MVLHYLPSQRRRIFAFTGRPGVGKSAVVEKFADSDGFPVVNMGEEMKRQHESLPIGDDRASTPTTTWEMAEALREEHGAGGAALASLTRVAAGFVENNVVVVDGVRTIEEVECFEETFGCPVHTVAVHADEQTRLERFTDRSGYYEAFESFGEDAELVAEAIAEYELNSRTKRETDVGLEDVLDYANYSINNDDSLSSANEQAARLLDHFDPLI